MNQFDPLSQPSVGELEQGMFDAFPEPAEAARRGKPAPGAGRGETGRRGKPARGKRKKTGVRTKNFVLDTNVLLHDPHCIHHFADNHVWIPVEVLSELDRFKNEQSERGANARAVHRHLTGVFKDETTRVTDGVVTEGGGTVRLFVPDFQRRMQTSKGLKRFAEVFSNLERVDHRIIAATLVIEEENPEPAILVTKDLNMQLKARAVGLICQDYLNDKVEARDVESYEIAKFAVEVNELQRFASSGELELEAERVAGLGANEYVLLEASNGKTIPARLYPDRRFRRLLIPDHLHIPRGIDIRPVNLGQQCFMDALLDPSLNLVTCYGQAGTGKTLVAVASGLHLVGDKDFSGMTISRPVVAMGDTLGFLPGDLDEKMRPWLQPIYDALEVLMPPPGLSAQESRKRGGKKQKNHQDDHGAGSHAGGAYRKPYEQLIEQGVVEIEALCYIRGRSIPRRFFVLDEAQQLTPLEAKTLVTRMSKGSKLVLVGDPAQIDNPYVDSLSNGLVYTRNRLKGQAIAAHVSLCKGERSELAEVGAKMM